MKFKQDKFKSDFLLRSFGKKGWFKSKFLSCPKCQKQDKFGLKMPDSTYQFGSCHCFHGSCGFHGSLFSLLRSLGKEFYFENVKEELSLSDKVENLLLSKQTTEEVLPLKSKPLGFKHINYDKYLSERGFLDYQYKKFNVGFTDLDPKFKDYLIFLIYQEDRLVGFLSRTRYSKKWHHQNEVLSKQGLAKLVPRYKNSPGVEFDKILGGEEDISEGTTTLILVEGIMDKSNTDRVLNLDFSEEIKCCYTFGNSISENQIKRIQKHKNISDIILLYDFNSIYQIQVSSLLLLNSFSCKVGEIPWDTDPGEMSFEEFDFVLNDLKDPFSYNLSRISPVILK